MAGRKMNCMDCVTAASWSARSPPLVFPQAPQCIISAQVSCENIFGTKGADSSLLVLFYNNRGNETISNPLNVGRKISVSGHSLGFLPRFTAA